MVSNHGSFTEPTGPAASTAYMVPVTCADNSPIPAPVAGLNPTSPIIEEAGESVIFGVPAKIAKLAAVPRSTIVVVPATLIKLT